MSRPNDSDLAESCRDDVLQDKGVGLALIPDALIPGSHEIHQGMQLKTSRSPFTVAMVGKVADDALLETFE